MRVLQIVPSISYGDAVSNDIFAIHKILTDNGYTTLIYSQTIDQRLSLCDIHSFDELDVSEDDIILMHIAVASSQNEWIKSQKCHKKVMIYHNITPPHFFSNYSKNSEDCCRIGLKQVCELKDSFDYVLADSDFNKQNLIEMGFRCKIDVMPIIIPFNDYRREPDTGITRKYNDSITNIIFVGRIAPNKKQEDVIASFYEYQKHYNSSSRLFIIGNPNGLETYDLKLKAYAEKLGVKNVIFTGHTSFKQIIAYYKIANVFLCMSEHEGFCVPLIESMFFNVPIIAYNSSAISGTLSGSGILIKNKNPLEVAGMINKLINDNTLRQTIVKNQTLRLQQFNYDKLSMLFLDYLNNEILH